MKYKMAADQVLKRFARQIRKEDASKEMVSALKNDACGIDRAAVFRASLRDAGPIVVPDPAINRQATVICPSGTRSGRRLRP